MRKVLADEHGQHIMGLYKDLAGAHGMLAGADDRDGESVLVRGEGRWADPGIWDHGYLFAPALTIGGGTGDVQRNIIAERVLDLPHDIDVEAGKTWAESRRAPAPA